MPTKLIEITTVISEVTDSRFVCIDFNESFKKAIMDFAAEHNKLNKRGELLINSPLWYKMGKPLVTVRAYPATKKAGLWHHSVKQFLNLISIVTVAIQLQKTADHNLTICVWFKNIRPSISSTDHSYSATLLENSEKPLTVYENKNVKHISTVVTQDFVEELI